MLLGRDRAAAQRVRRGHRRQHPGFLVLGVVVAVLVVELQEPIECDDRSGGPQCEAAAVGDVHADLIELGGGHLRGDRALPHQIVQPPLVRGQEARHRVRFTRDIGGADRLVRFLRVLRLGGVFARCGGQIVGAEAGAHMAANGFDRLARHLHAVGAHIGDQPLGLTVQIDALIQLLRHAHGLLGAEAKLARRFLLQGRGGEGRRRIAADAAAFDRADGELTRLHRRFGAGRKGFGVQVELIQPLAVQMRQPRGERRAGRGRETGFHGPVFAGAERLDLRLAVADQAQRDRLHPPGAAAAGQLAPQHRGQGETYQVIQRAAGQVGFDQRLVEVARVRHRGADGGAGDFVEGDAADVDALERMFLGQHRLDVPRDRLAFPVRVGR